MPEFSFDENSSFEENLESFLKEMDGVDAEMAAVLRANTGKLRKIINEGKVDRDARAEFNKSVVETLDRLLSAEEEKS